MLLAAADPVGTRTLVWRAAEALGLEREALEPASIEQLLEIGARVRFRHPLVRSAVYRAASASDRRVVHGALASAIDPEADPDRRAWHRAHAATKPDEDVAAELIASASRAQRRGGIGRGGGVSRACGHVHSRRRRAGPRGHWRPPGAKFDAADLVAAESLLATAAVGPLDELGRAQVQRVRAQIAFDLRRGSDAPALLLRAARTLEPLDAELARETYLEALVAVVYAARLATGTDVTDVAGAARSAPIGPEPLPARQLLLLGLAARLTDGYAAAAPLLKRALRAYRDEERQLDWLCVPYRAWPRWTCGTTVHGSSSRPGRQSSRALPAP